ncbi:thioesterase family protein, partial [Desulfonatronum sp. SC1]|uniref:acyl-CoA thioesterase n=1 Tax=Desulfonatronum sp. SC1 TaxID=2109626 RepID=UPI000D30C031
GYVYHANYVAYCHQARTELLRKFGINDKKLEASGIMMPVIGMNLKYHRPGHYDEPLTITTIIHEMPAVRFNFTFEIRNERNELVCSAESTVVFVDANTRKPMKAPEMVINALAPAFEPAIL